MANSREVYRGSAKITDVVIEDLSDKERMNIVGTPGAECAFKLVYTVSAPDGRSFSVKEEISHRPLQGKMLMFNQREDGAIPTQIDIAIKDLVGQGILPKGASEQDIALAASDSLVGRSVTVYAKEDEKADGSGWWPAKAYFTRSTLPRLTGEDKAARIAAFLGKPVAAAPKPVAPVAPAPEDDEALPF